MTDGLLKISISDTIYLRDPYLVLVVGNIICVVYSAITWLPSAETVLLSQMYLQVLLRWQSCIDCVDWTFLCLAYGMLM